MVTMLPSTANQVSGMLFAQFQTVLQDRICAALSMSRMLSVLDSGEMLQQAMKNVCGIDIVLSKACQGIT